MAEQVGGRAFRLGVFPAGPVACWAGVGGVARALRPLQKTSSGSWFGSPAVREHMGPYGHIGEALATEGGLAAAILAFWIYVGTASHQGQGGGGQNGTSVSTLGLGRWPSPSTHLPGQTGGFVPRANPISPGQLCEPPCMPHPALTALRPSGRGVLQCI